MKNMCGIDHAPLVLWKNDETINPDVNIWAK